MSTTSREYRERLIDEVKRFPVLYDTRHEHNHDIDARDRCWADIAHKLGANSEVLKREWKILRDSFRQSLKKARAAATTKSGLPCKRWRFHQRMAFLLPYMTKRTRHSHSLREVMKLDVDGELSEAGEAGEGGKLGEYPGPVGGSEAADALDLFFASVCCSARRLPANAQRRLKRQVLDALLRCEEEAWDPPPAPEPSHIMDDFKQ